MDSKTRLGLNIRALRNAYGETQEELGVALNLEKNTVSSYENGKREPSRDILSDIARHYMVSVEELTFSDLTGIGKFNLDKNAFWRNIEIVFPLIKSDAALKSEHFYKAYTFHQDFYNELHNVSLEKIDNVDVCYDEYLEAYDEEDAKAEAAGNFLGLWYLMTMMLRLTPEVLKSKPAAIVKLAEKDKEAKKVLENQDSTLEADSKEILESLDDPEIVEMLNEMKTTLKRSQKWSDLADYYLALDYVYHNVKNGLEWDFNRRIGLEMLDAFASVGNIYAKRFNKLGIDAIRGSSQNEDDR